MKINFLKSLLAIACLLCSIGVYAHDFEVDGIYYNKLSSTEVEVTYRGSSYSSYINEYTGSVVIPASITYNGTTYNVTSIGNRAFQECTGLTEIVIGNSVTSIGNSAFEGCTGLTSVTIPNSVTSIRYAAFYCCTGLTEVTIPNSVTSLGAGAFRDCTGLTTLNFNAENCTTMWSDWPEPVFEGCSNLTTVNIGNNVKTIPDYAFYGCTGLTSITIPNSVTSIGASAFNGCTGLTSLTIGNSVTSIEYAAFRGCTCLTILNFNAENCTTMGSDLSPVFYACDNLTTVNIGESVKIIPDYAFYDCTGLTEITIPNSVTSIGWHVFSYCIGLSSIVVDKDNQAYDSRDNCNAIIETATNTLITGCKNSFIPNSVTSIGWHAFAECTCLTEITIPNSVTSIGYAAFEGCTGLTEITIPNSVTSIGAHAFSGCTGLKTLICEAIVPPTIGYNTFDEVNADIYISYRSSDAYKLTSWGNFNLNVITKIIDDVCYVVTNIADREAGITRVADKGVSIVVLPDSILQDSILHDTFRVTSIEVEAFKDCIELDEIVVSNSVEYIGNSAFEGCTGLRSVTLGSGVNEIGENTFTLCDRIKTVNCYAEVPPTIYSNTFTVYTNDNATLHVVKGCKDAYADAKYWKYFLNITDDLTAGVEDITCDNSDAPAEYYDLNGFRIENPTRGIYIVKQGDIVRKVFVNKVR